MDNILSHIIQMNFDKSDLIICIQERKHACKKHRLYYDLLFICKYSCQERGNIVNTFIFVIST